MIKTITNVLFGILSFIVIIIISLGIRLDFQSLRTVEFWAAILIKWALTMVIFNYTLKTDVHNKKHNPDGRFYKSFQTLKQNIKVIHDNKLYNALAAAITVRNEQIQNELWTNRIHKISVQVDYDDILTTDKTASEMVEEYHIVKPRKIKRFTRVYDQIKGGEPFKRFGLFPVKPIKEDYFLKDNELSYVSVDEFAYSSIKETISRNVTKTVIFLVMNVGTTIISYSFTAANFWAELVSNLFTMLSAIISGVSTATSCVKNATQIYENRNDFLVRNLDIKQYIKAQ